MTPIPRRARIAGLTLLLAAGLLPATAPIADAHPSPHRPAIYTLSGDDGGSKFEGIGYDRRNGRYYVSETTGGEIHRGDVERKKAHEWLAGDGTDGRWTARGITVDKKGRIFIAGGPNSTDHPGAPDLWVYSRSGKLLAALKTGLTGVVMNDVALGPDGAAYFTDSGRPQIFKVWKSRSGWQVKVWRDASTTITQQTGFNLNGIVLAPDRKSLLTVQSNAGKLWRFDLCSAKVSEVEVTGASLISGDGLVLRGRELTVVRNFPRLLTTVKLSKHARSARFVSEIATDPDRVFTTGKIARGRLLLVDSKFDETTATPPYNVVPLPIP